MKYQKTFYLICGAVFASTLAVFTVIMLGIFKIVKLATWQFILLGIGFLIISFLSFACACIIQTIYDDWKRRHIRINAKR